MSEKEISQVDLSEFDTVKAIIDQAILEVADKFGGNRGVDIQAATKMLGEDLLNLSFALYKAKTAANSKSDDTYNVICKAIAATARIATTATLPSFQRALLESGETSIYFDFDVED